MKAKKPGMPSAGDWWRRAAAAVKDRRSLCLTAVRCSSGGPRLPSDLESAVIRATSHDERGVDRNSAGRVLASARSAPHLLSPFMWALARRAGHTRSWAVALKSLMLAHGLVLVLRTPFGRLPFDLSDFHARGRNAHGFSAFVRAYFGFLDRQSTLPESADLERVEAMQELLGLLMGIRPCADGMEVGLVLEAMDCVVVEIFDVYSRICSGIAGFLVGILHSNPSPPTSSKRKRGAMGIAVLRRAGEQSGQLAAYFELCRRLGVMKAAEFPVVERIPEEDIRDLEKLVLGGIPKSEERSEVERFGTVVSKEWVVFDDEVGGHFGNPFLDDIGNLIELM